MVATVQIVEKNGPTATPVATDKTAGTVRFNNADAQNPGTSNPLIVPTAGLDWAYMKQLRLNCTVAPDTQLTNPKFYTDGAAPGDWTGVSLYAEANAAYVAPNEPTTTPTGGSDAFGYVSGTPLALGTTTKTDTGEFGEHLQLSMSVGTASSQGSLTAESVTFSYDEI